MLGTLVSPVGLVGSVRRVLPPRGLSRVEMRVAAAGSGRPGRGADHHTEHGSGRALDNGELARTVAIAEAAERYAGVNLHDRPVLARLGELTGAVLDMDALAQCSPAEYAHPDSPVAPFDPDAEIRWLQGTDLATGVATWVPAVMTCYGLPRLPGERFWYQISTGMAVHTSYERALCGAITEVIERDLIAVLWLARMPVPPLADAALTDTARHLLDWCSRHFIDVSVFDATSDLGVPIAYCVQAAEHDDRAHRVVGCATGDTIGLAAEKALFEAISVREAFYSRDPVPDTFAGFSSVVHGARYMGRPERAAAFDFLYDGVGQRPVSAGPPPLPDNPHEQLRLLVRRLVETGLHTVAVDRTSRELAAAGLVAVSVVIPGLQPMSLNPLAQFRAGRRLTELPARLGHPYNPDAELNPWPQPFA